MSEAPTGVEPSGGSTEAGRREKLERLRAEGVDPYPRAGLPDRDRIYSILEAHDPEELGEGEHSAVLLPDRRAAGRPARPRQDGLLRRPRPDRLDPGLRPPRRPRRGGVRADRGPRHRRHGRRRGRPLRDQARPAGARGARVHDAGQGAARPARPLPRHLRPRDPLPPARTRPDGERALARDLRDAGEAGGRDPRAHERARLRRGRNADPAAHRGRRRRASLHHPPQLAQPRAVPAHRDRALPEAGDRRRLRERLRAGQVLPQRGYVAPAQPRVHDARVVRQLRRLRGRDDLRRADARDRGRAGAGDDDGRARRSHDRLQGPVEADLPAGRNARGDRRRHPHRGPRRDGRAARRGRRARTADWAGSSTRSRAS